MSAAFSCFADLALTSPQDYRLEGQGSLMQCVLTPAEKFMPMTNEQIAAYVHAEVLATHLGHLRIHQVETALQMIRHRGNHMRKRSISCKSR